MRFRKATAPAFGVLRDGELEFGPGLNVVHGPNEVGKSTWHTVLVAGLCGQRRSGEGARKEKTIFEQRHRPWGSGDDVFWATAVEIELDEGRGIEITRNFGSGATELRDPILGTKLPLDFAGHDLINDRSLDGARLVGLDREAFAMAASVRQASILADLKNADALQTHLARAAAGSEGGTAAGAIDSIKRYKQEHVGVKRKKATKPLRQAIDANETAGAHLECVQAEHASYLLEVECVDAKRRELAELQGELSIAEAAHEWRQAADRADEFSAKIESLTALAERAGDGEHLDRNPDGTDVEFPGAVDASPLPLAGGTAGPLRGRVWLGVAFAAVGVVASVLAGILAGPLLGAIIGTSAMAGTVMWLSLRRRSGAQPSVRDDQYHSEAPEQGTHRFGQAESPRDPLKAVTDAATAQGEFRNALEGRTLADWHSDAEDARGGEIQKRRALEEVGGSVDAVGTLDEAEARSASLRRCSEETRVELSRLEGRLSRVRADSVNVAEAEARLAETAAELGRVRSLEATLDTTMRFMERAAESAHRLLAPKVASEVGELVGRITAGGYRSVLVDPGTLNVTLVAASGERHDAKLVSRGTTEQVYLALRLVLAKVLSDGYERCPVLLDDVTVHADAERKAAILECLLDVANDRQVILFSQEQQVLDWARSRSDAGVHLIELGPAQPA